MNQKLNRRKFFKNITELLGFITTSHYFFPNVLLGKSQDKKIDLAVVKGNPEHAVTQSFKVLGGMEKFVKPGNIVLLKPNISFPNPQNFGSTTNPNIVRIVAEQVLNAGAKRVFVADNTMRDGNVCFEKTGILSTLKDVKNVKVLPLQKESLFEEVAVKNGTS